VCSLFWGSPKVIIYCLRCLALKAKTEEMGDLVPTIFRPEKPISVQTLIMLMSITEAGIVTLCNGVRQIFNLQEYFNQRKPDVINRATNDYLKRHLQIDTSGYRDIIGFVDSLRMIRNCIVHSEGHISWRNEKEEAALQKFIDSTTMIEINNHGQIVILEGFIEE
jgi:hypothetical protein